MSVAMATISVSAVLQVLTSRLHLCGHMLQYEVYMRLFSVICASSVGQCNLCYCSGRSVLCYCSGRSV